MIARGLAKQGFSNIEPVDCKSVYTAARKLKSGSDEKRFEATLDFLKQCMSGIERADFIKAVASRSLGGKLGTAKFGNELIGLGLALRSGGGDEACLALIEAFQRLPTTHTYRQQMYSAMKSALKMTTVGDSPDLLTAIWEVQNRIRHAGRRISYRSVGSTLLVKGLEFSNVIVVHSPKMNRKDWYVAITRATHTLKILSPLERFTPVA
jgi:DNA helicase-2/ATP-dependent DNA helicase PcrA